MVTAICSHGGVQGTSSVPGLADPHRPELQVHLLPILGSFADARGRVQETYAGRLAGASRVHGNAPRCAPAVQDATNRCLTRAARRAGARQSWNFLLRNRPCRRRATRPSVCSRFLTPSSMVPSTGRPS